ncbi:hypothetical protein JR316_0003638 [Psilocybe cubensis]|uniref:Uncharacterized protein n=2 Tax=Psilocybe cubensis TaxID=181762 RepID=A0ACB8H839_PSICU|nr:hypothetical protein JR316_0003638 [Psilocybe cubensis]KAH9484158.1 hypothetical protein JR316_0003638 [Psilocybe cubensis]
MSPRGPASATSPTTRTSSTPYSRRSASQPKSSRQQFSACGACRMRRVRCDLKDLPVGFVGPHPACSNCKERGIKCVDEFADVKAVKLLRRGRRLQQVEAIYGKVADQDDSSSGGLNRPLSIPTLHIDFFASPFWRWLTIQRPILDSHEFLSRFTAHMKGTQPLTSEGGLIAMLLVTWAASVGLNERGLPEDDTVTDDQSTLGGGSPLEGSSSRPAASGKYQPPGSRRREWKTKTESYIRELLELIDLHGILRRPSLDGVRALLLLLPLLDEAQPLERLAISEATFSHIQALCVIAPSPPFAYEEATARARLFWYAYTHEGLTTGIRGGRFVLNSDDLEAFQRTLPMNNNTGHSGLNSPISGPLDGIDPYHLQDSAAFNGQESPARRTLMQLMHSSAAPLDLSNLCRKIHTVLTGVKATRRTEEHGVIDADGMRDIWRGLDRCWQELEVMKQQISEQDNLMRRLEINQYVSAWQIFIFECHNVIRESLKGSLSSSSAPGLYDPSSSRPSSHSSNSSPYLSPHQLHFTANRKCLQLLPQIINLIRTHTPREHSDVPSIFRWDAGLVRDGCFFAAYLVANLEGDFVDGGSEDEKPKFIDLTVDEGVSICLTALATMRWGYSKSEEREETIKMIWEGRKQRRQGRSHHVPLYDSDYPQPMALSGPNVHLSLSPSPSMAGSSLDGRPILRPLTLYPPQRRVESAPSTACSTDDRGSNAWPSYTPPGTSTSVDTSTGTGFSRRGSPVFSNMSGFKSADDMFYHGVTDVDQFSYNVPVSTPMIRNTSSMVNGGYGHRHSPIDSQALVASTGSNYTVTTPFNATYTSILTQLDFSSCIQFGENCNAGYH